MKDQTDVEQGHCCTDSLGESNGCIIENGNVDIVNHLAGSNSSSGSGKGSGSSSSGSMGGSSMGSSKYPHTNSNSCGINSCNHGYVKSPRDQKVPLMRPATSTAAMVLRMSLGHHLSVKDKEDNEKSQMSRTRIMASIIAMSCFFTLACFTTMAFSWIYEDSTLPTDNSIMPNDFETTVSFQYDGNDIYQEGLFKLIHHKHKARGQGTPEVGCVAFYDDSNVIGQRDHKELCLIDYDRVQTLRFKPSDIRIPADVTVSTGPDTFITLYYEGVATNTLFNVHEKGLWSLPIDEIAVTFIKDHVYSDDDQIMVEVDGPISIPPSCVLFSNKALSNRDVNSFMMCGRAGVDTVVMNHDSFAELGVDMKKLAADFSHVYTGELATIDMYTLSSFRGPVLSVSSDQKIDLADNFFTSLADENTPSGELKAWSQGLSGIRISLK